METQVLTHKTRTIQDILNEMTPEQKDFQALIVGAAIEDEDISEDASVVAEYNALSDEHRYLIDFFVGNILSENPTMEHGQSMMVDNFLAHFGVKGMKWGVRKAESGPTSRLSKSNLANSEGRKTAREVVKGGNGTLLAAHAAGIKSKGHRAINAFTGDKTFWKRMAIAAGVTGVAVGVSLFAPPLLPASVLTSVAQLATGTKGIGGYVMVDGALTKLTEVGALTLQVTGLGLASIGAGAATAVNVGTNATRAVLGNSRIDKSANRLGKNMLARQTTGSKRVNKILNRDGSISKKDLKQSALLGDFLAHHSSVSLKEALENL